jgi:Tol biopolymer transport system component
MFALLSSTACFGRDGATAQSSGNRIAFVSDLGGQPGLLVVDSIGGDAMRIVAGNIGPPEWSPDGCHLLFVRDRDLRLVDSTGRSETSLASNTSAMQGLPVPSRSYQWSPDGSLIAFVSAGDVFLVAPDGSNPTTLTTGLAVQSASWSPDGAQLTFAARQGSGNAPGIYVANRAAGGIRLVAPGNGSSPAWSPDGSRIAFRAGVEPPAIAVVNADGTDLRTLVSATPEGFLADFAWSPDGTRLALVMDQDTERPNPTVWLLAISSGELTKVLEGVVTLAEGHSFAWSPDGIELVVSRRDVATRRSRLYVSDVAGKNVRPLTSSQAGNEAFPNWARRRCVE